MRIASVFLLPFAIAACGEFTDGGANTPQGPEPSAEEISPGVLGRDDSAAIKVRGVCEAAPAEGWTAPLPPLEQVGTLEDMVISSPAEALICSEVYLGNKVECELQSESFFVVERDDHRLVVTAPSGPVIVTLTPGSISCERYDP